MKILRNNAVIIVIIIPTLGVLLSFLAAPPYEVLLPFLGPTGGPHYRALGLGQRPYIDGFPKALHELETLRRSAKVAAATTAAAAAATSATAATAVAAAAAAVAVTPTGGGGGVGGGVGSGAGLVQQLSSNYSSPNSTINSDCQVYKPNAPHIQGKPNALFEI